jgi:DNA-directed RNA polymerase sigma subunit (sigma70/sigma32)
LGKHIIDKIRRHRINLDNDPLFEKLDISDLEQLKEGLQYVNQLVIPLEDKIEQDSLTEDINRIFNSLLTDEEKKILMMSFGLNGYDVFPINAIARRLNIPVKQAVESYACAIAKIQNNDEAINILEFYKR